MMRLSHPHILLAACLTFFLTGCLEFDISTEVHDDASVTRTVLVTGDSAEIFDSELPVSIDDRWTRSLDTSAEGKFVMTAVRSFPDADAMNAALSDSAGVRLRITASLTKSFNWFFTRYSYPEPWHHYHPFGNIPLTEYLAPAELELAREHILTDAPYKNPGDSLALEDAERRFEEWRLRNMFESYYTAVLDGARTLNHPELPPENIEAKKEALFEAGAHSLDQGRLEESAKSFAAVLQSDHVYDALAANTEAVDRFDARRRMVGNVWKHDYSARIKLPGILQKTNAPSIEGNTAVWSDFINFCYIGDVSMTADSRSVNWWMIILLAIIIVMLLLSLVATALRRRKANLPRWQ